MKKNVYRIGEICEIKSGKRLPKNCDFAQRITAFPYIRGRDIKNGKINTENLFYIEEDVYIKIKKYIIETDDIALTIVGSVGDVAYATDAINGYNLTENAVRLTNFKDFVNSKYLYYVLNQRQYYNYMQLIAGAAAQPKLGIYKIERIRVELPNIYTQQRIASILSAYDDLIENNNRRIKILEQMAENLYKEWFVRFRFPGHEQAEFENGIPKGWNRNSISEFYKTSSGGTPSRAHERYYEDGIYPWVKTGELKDSIILETEEYITLEAIQKTAAKLHPNKAVAMAMYGVNIGMLGYFDSQMACNQACCVFADRRNFSSRHYLFYCLKSMRDYLLLISFGAAQQNLSQDLIKKIKILMPADDVVKAFEDKVEKLYESIRILLLKNKNLTKQRDLLLPRLMSGKLEV